MTQQFKAGDKVKVIEGGWGMHPEHIGKIVTIHSVLPSSDGPQYTRYTTVESLPTSRLGSGHRGKDSAVRGETFELVEAGKSLEDQIRAINVKMKDKEAQAVALAAEQEALKRERQVLIAALLKELDA